MGDGRLMVALDTLQQARATLDTLRGRVAAWRQSEPDAAAARVLAAWLDALDAKLEAE